MPVRIVAGKNKHGNEKVYHLPNKLLDARGNVVWEEWKIKNSFRDKLPADLFGPNGRKFNEPPKVILGPNGKPIPPIIIEIFTAREIREVLAKSRAQQDKKGVEWQTRRLRNAGRTLAQIELISKRKDFSEADKVIWSIKKLLNDSFFGTAIMTGKIVIPEQKGLNLRKLQEIMQDHFFEAYKKEKEQRKTQYDEADKKTLKHGKDIVIAHR